MFYIFGNVIHLTITLNCDRINGERARTNKRRACTNKSGEWVKNLVQVRIQDLKKLIDIAIQIKRCGKMTSKLLAY